MGTHRGDHRPGVGHHHREGRGVRVVVHGLLEHDAVAYRVAGRGLLQADW
ncbi:TPA: hypothetical protein ACQXLH_002123 [Streptococcus pneumoniae]